MRPDLKFQNRIIKKSMPQNNIQILLPQKIHPPFIKDGIVHYISKLKPYATIQMIESKDEKKFYEHCQKLEKETITIILDSRGRQFNSVYFSKTWEQLTTQKMKDISFIVGGPYGFSHEPRSDLTLSLSSFTLNHELVPLILLEQVYRAYTILKGLPYHHA
ncbi:MAG TPA: hypothetical protein DD708_01680 [Deltaproteobacteria bacterium]|nr:hypothetical protein [Deltaproteobacteria bacterium]